MEMGILLTAVGELWLMLFSQFLEGMRILMTPKIGQKAAFEVRGGGGAAPTSLLYKRQKIIATLGNYESHLFLAFNFIV